MNIHYRLENELKAATCRAAVLSLVSDFLEDAGVDGDAFLPGILSLDGITAPVPAVPALALPGPAPADEPDENLAEFEEMVAEPEPVDPKPAPRQSA
ncbi:MAG: hypothetical protein GY953_30700, partial [bacterium]|nr:hypothetical protein [bacterium]